MDTNQAANMFAALSQPIRLGVLRILIQHANTGMLAGEIWGALKVKQNTMSTNLSVLLHAGLVRKVREGRGIRYFPDMDGVQNVLSFLMEDCCGGRTEICQPALRQIICSSEGRNP